MGVQINGDTGNISATKADYSGNVTIGGTLTYEDVTNIDSVGLVTAREGIEVGARPGVAASISVDGNMIVSGISTFGGDVIASSTLYADSDLFVVDQIRHTGDTNTAIRFPAADTFTVETSGAEHLRIASTGRLSIVNNNEDIDMDSSSSGQLHIDGNGYSGAIALNATAMNIYTNASSRSLILGTNETERLRIEPAGNVNVSQNLNVAGVVTATSFSGSGANLTGVNAISVAQQFRLAADQAGSGSAGTVLTNWEEADTDYQRIGSTVWSQSSGVFSCSATGIYLCMWTLVCNDTSTGDAFDPNIQISTNSGSNWSTRSRSWGHIQSGSTARDSPANQFLFDVSNTSTFRLRYRQSEDNDLATGTTIAGGSSENLTNIIFIRIGDT